MIATSRQKTARNASLYRQWQAGEGGTRLAKRFGISRARVYQVIAEHGVRTRESGNGR